MRIVNSIGFHANNQAPANAALVSDLVLQLIPESSPYRGLQRQMREDREWGYIVIQRASVREANQRDSAKQGAPHTLISRK